MNGTKQPAQKSRGRERAATRTPHESTKSAGAAVDVPQVTSSVIPLAPSHYYLHDCIYQREAEKGRKEQKGGEEEEESPQPERSGLVITFIERAMIRAAVCP